MSRRADLNHLREMLKKSKVLFNEPMSGHTSLRVGGPADVFVTAESRQELAGILRYAGKRNIPVFFAGWGTNLLVGDRGIRGITVKLGSAFNSVKVNRGSVEAGAAVPVSKLLGILAEKGLSGIEFMSGIPGTAGGAVAGNAGSPKEAIGDHVRSVKVMDMAGRTFGLTGKKLDFSYRHSNLTGKRVAILSVELKGFKKVPPIIIRKRMSESRNKKRKVQPVEKPSAGCVFKNPNGCSAGLLIDLAGLKGERAGGAAVSTKHANFILNSGHATAGDIMDLAKTIQKKVREQFGVRLELEVQKVGVF